MVSDSLIIDIPDGIDDIKTIIGRDLAKYHDLSVARRSTIYLCLRHRQIIDLPATNKSRYFARPRPIIDNYLIV